MDNNKVVLGSLGEPYEILVESAHESGAVSRLRTSTEAGYQTTFYAHPLSPASTQGQRSTPRGGKHQ